MNNFKLAIRYSVVYHHAGSLAGKTDLVVVFEDRSTYQYSGLTPETAHHLVDLLRNEKPIWVNPKNGLLVVANEPIGSGEE